MELNKLKSIISANKYNKFVTKIEKARYSDNFDKASVITHFEKILQKQTFLLVWCEHILKETYSKDVADEVTDSENTARNQDKACT